MKKSPGIWVRTEAAKMSRWTHTGINHYTGLTIADFCEWIRAVNKIIAEQKK